MATLNVGTINFGEDVFMNRAADTEEMARRIRAHGATPEVEVYDAGHLDIAAELLKQGLSDGAAAPAVRPRASRARWRRTSAISSSSSSATETMLPSGCSWGVAGVGRHQLPMAELAAMWGGNARVGLEDNVWLDKGVLAEGSAPLVARAVELCGRHGRAVATVAEARAMLGLKAR